MVVIQYQTAEAHNFRSVKIHNFKKISSNYFILNALKQTIDNLIPLFQHKICCSSSVGMTVFCAQKYDCVTTNIGRVTKIGKPKVKIYIFHFHFLAF